MDKEMETAWLDAVKWNDAGLVAVIAQDVVSHRILMMAWMNRESLALTVETGQAVYWSRSRQRLWRKGEASGNEQILCDLRLDCDGDTILISVKQKGGIACHTGRESCFYRQWDDSQWKTIEPVIKDPKEMYRSS